MPEIINGQPSASNVESHITTDEPATTLNTTHRSSDGKNHADVVTNTADVATNVTAIGLNTTHRGSDGSNHSKANTAYGWGDHAGLYGNYVNRENPTVDWEQIKIDSTITGQNDFHLIDATATFQTDNVQVGDVVYNAGDAAYSYVAAINSQIDLTLEANIFPASDGDRYYVYQFRANGTEDELDISSIVSGAKLVRIKIHAKQTNAGAYIKMYKKGESGQNISTWKIGIANTELFYELLVAPDGSDMIEYIADNVEAPPNTGGDYWKMTIVGWWT